MELDRPIILLGAARSGTTLLGHIVTRHPSVAFWGEPRPVWMHGHAYQDHDELDETDATPEVARYVRDAFERYVSEAGRARFAEKTPSNCLRVRFIHALFPDCRVVHIIRDGRATVRSILAEQRKPPGKGRLRKRLRETPVRDWPAYVPVVMRTLWRSKVMRQRSTWWGPRPREWKAWLDLPPHVQAARQWRACVEAAIRDGRTLPPETYLEIRYEDLIRRPLEIVEEVRKFADLSNAEAVREYIHTHVDADRPSRRHDPLDARVERDVVEETRPLLQQLGY